MLMWIETRLIMLHLRMVRKSESLLAIVLHWTFTIMLFKLYVIDIAFDFDVLEEYWWFLHRSLLEQLLDH